MKNQNNTFNRFNGLRLLALLAVMMLSANTYAQGDSELYDCLIEPNVTASVGSPVQGVLAEALVDRGEFVTKGQPIARLEATSEIASLEHARLRAAMASEIEARKADLRLAMVNLDRQAQMKKQGLETAQKYDEAVARRDVAQASLIQAQENIQLLLLEQKQAERRVDERTLKSPIDGVVVEQHTFPGEFVYDNAILTVAQIHPLRVEVVLPARLFKSYSPGDVAVIRPELEHATEIYAAVDVVDRLLDTRSGTFGIRLMLHNEDLSIPGGQKCQLMFRSRLSEASQ